MPTISDDLFSRAKTFDVTGNIDPLDKRLHREIKSRCNCVYQNSTLDAVDEVQSGAVGARTGGTMDLTINLVDGQSVVVTGLVFDAAASAVQTALDSAAALAITDYVAGDIAVTGGPFAGGGAPTIFTFNGVSVRGNHPLVIVDGVNLTGPSEVQDGTVGDRTGGTMDLTFTLENAETFDVTALVFDAAASVLQTAVDAAAASTITGYVAGDIAITGGPFAGGGATTVVTFSGDSVHGDHPLVTVDGTNLTGGTTDPVFSEDTAGAADPLFSQSTAGVVPRFWFAALKALGVLVGTDPTFGATPAGQYTVNLRDSLENYPSNETIRKLLKEATVAEGQDWESEILPLLGL